MINFDLYAIDVDTDNFDNINEKNSTYLLNCSITESIDYLESDLEVRESVVNKYKTDNSVCSVGSMDSILIDMEAIDINDLEFLLDGVGSGIHDAYLGKAIIKFSEKIKYLKESRLCIIDEIHIYAELENKGLGSEALSTFLYNLKHVYYVDYVFLYPCPIYYEKNANIDVLRDNLYRFYSRFGFKEMPVDVKYDGNSFYYLEL